MENNQAKMRIISGKFKGKNIKFLKSTSTRPLKDSVKENIFNILVHSKKINIKIENSKVLDLYSGIGSFGLECLSRGAKTVTFIEQNKIIFKILKENLVNFSLDYQSKSINEKVENILQKKIDEKYNIFFFDPPYADIKFKENLNFIRHSNIFAKNHIVIIHREYKSEDELEKFFKICEEKIYGRSKVIFGTFV